MRIIINLLVFFIVCIGIISCESKVKKIESSNTYFFKDIVENLNWERNILNDNEEELKGYNSKGGKTFEIFVSKEDILIYHFEKSQKEGISYFYSNGKLINLTFFEEGKKVDIDFSLDANFLLTQLTIYSNKKEMGFCHFYKNGDIRGCKFNAKEFLRSKEEYKNGQKAFEYIEENGTKYWVVYNPEGEMLVKYPTDNDFCKAEFYDNGKKVEIPYFFDQKEFEEIYEKIKNDVNKS